MHNKNQKLHQELGQSSKKRLSGLLHDSQYGYNKSKIGDEGYI
jgi:hypothetical protein